MNPGPRSERITSTYSCSTLLGNWFENRLGQPTNPISSGFGNQTNCRGRLNNLVNHSYGKAVVNDTKMSSKYCEVRVAAYVNYVANTESNIHHLDMEELRNNYTSMNDLMYEIMPKIKAEQCYRDAAKLENANDIMPKPKEIDTLQSFGNQTKTGKNQMIKCAAQIAKLSGTTEYRANYQYQGASNTHWGYSSAASAYSPYLASSGLSSCTTPTSAQFNNPALGFTCSSNDQANNQDFSGATNRDCVPMLPDSTASDLDQHLSNLVGSTSGQMTHHSLLGSSGQTSISSTVNGGGGGGGAGSAGGGGAGNPVTNSILVPRYHTNTNNDYNVHSSQNGPRSLSDSSQAESPVQEDLLSTNTPNLGSGSNTGGTGAGSGAGTGANNSASSVVSGTGGAINNSMIVGNQNFPGIVNQTQHASAYGGGAGVGVGVGVGGGPSGGAGAGCNGSLYPVLPASLLYSQLYTAANQTAHGFHSHALPSHASPNSSVHGELQSVMDHISNVGVRQQHNIMTAGGGVAHPGDLTLIGNCGASVRNIEDGNTNRQVAALAAHRGHHNPTDNGGSVWRPY